MEDERLCSLFLTICPGLGGKTVKTLIDHMGSAAAVIERRKELSGTMGNAAAAITAALGNTSLLGRAEQELEFAEKNRITCLTLKSEDYPSRLRMCADAPVVLFYKGTADLNNLHTISIVGTRHATEYGKQCCGDFLQELAELRPDTLVVSGLAYGIDIHAHRTALRCGLDTVGVLAHGLDRIYPYEHRRTAAEMTGQGGLLTEFLTGTEPDRYNFVRRNRIVAGLSDAVIVMESASKGGSLITAELANGYDRECFALPGRVTDNYSAGCNKLIQENKAAMLLSAKDFMDCMKWGTVNRDEHARPVQRNLFVELTPEEERVVKLLKERGDLHINTLVVNTNIPVHLMSGLLFELEMKGVVKAMVGGMYHLL